MISRRGFVRNWISFFAAALLSAIAIADPQVERPRRIAGGEGRYIGWPTMTRLRSGEIVAVFSGDRQDHICPWGKVQIVRSKDQGATWTKPQTIANDLIDDRDSGLVELKNGDLALFYFTSLAFAEPAHKDYWEKHPDWKLHYLKIGEEEAKRQFGAWVRLSSDGGKTWSERISTYAKTPHGAVLLRDGTLFLLGSRRIDGKKRYFAVESKDRGRTWKTVTELKMEGVEPHWSLGEPSLFEGRDGTLHGYFRYELGERHMIYVKSTDRGRTWSKPVTSDIDGFPPHFLRLRDGRVVCSYGRRTDGRTGIFARISSDDGKIWGKEVELLRFGNRDLGYASTVELDDGSLLTAYYLHFNGEPMASLCTTKWKAN